MVSTKLTVTFKLETLRFQDRTQLMLVKMVFFFLQSLHTKGAYIAGFIETATRRPVIFFLM